MNSILNFLIYKVRLLRKIKDLSKINSVESSATLLPGLATSASIYFQPSGCGDLRLTLAPSGKCVP